MPPSSIPARTDPLQPLFATTSPDPSAGLVSEHMLYVFQPAGGGQGLDGCSAGVGLPRLHLSAPAHC